jgi:glycine/D-amino acid oxidase-like deaminating enzyme
MVEPFDGDGYDCRPTLHTKALKPWHALLFRPGKSMKEHYDAVIIGGGLMGCSTAYFLASDPDFQGRILLLEKDRSYRQSASALSTSGFRQQFSTAVNIALSQFSIEFIRQANQKLALGDESPGIEPVEAGYLYLGDASAVPAFVENNRLQRSLGVDAVLLEPAELRTRLPWLNVEDVAIGSLGLSGEGWMDGYLFMTAFGRKAQQLGASFCYEEVKTLDVASNGVFSIGLASGTQLFADHVINTAGTRAPMIAAMLGIKLPVEAIKQSVYLFDSPFDSGKAPFIFTPDGLFFRREGSGYIAGLSIGREPKAVALSDFEVDYEVFDEMVWPKLAFRAQPFEELRLRSGWAGHYDMSMFDRNPFIGRVAGVDNFYLASGFSGHGMMQSPGVGCALSELITYGNYRSLDLTELGIERLQSDRTNVERIQY